MRGEVEIWQGDELLYVEPNMIVDGAGELLADVMTVSPSLSAVNHLGTSSILDASNYRIQAISFGTGKDAFVNNAAAVTNAKNSIYYKSSPGLQYFSSLGFTGNSAFLATNNRTLIQSGIVPVVTTCPAQDIINANLLVSSQEFNPIVGVPMAPNPHSEVLEPNIDFNQQLDVNLGHQVYALESVPAEPRELYVSSYFPPFGQLPNFLPSSIAFTLISGVNVKATPFVGSAMAEDASGDNTFSSNNVYNVVRVAATLGAFPDSSSVLPAGSNYAVNFYRVASNANFGAVSLAGTTNFSLVSSIKVVGGYFNSAGSMDCSGFVTMIMSSVPNGSYGMSSTASGLCLSANSNFSSNGVVEYSVTLASGDLTFANAYGGIYHLGLWTIDMEKSLRNGNSPPFSFTVINNPRKYKLFCRKGLSKNLCYSTRESQRSDLTIKWKLHFL